MSFIKSVKVVYKDGRVIGFVSYRPFTKPEACCLIPCPGLKGCFDSLGRPISPICEEPVIDEVR
jgi:hypothetical protein